MKALLCLLVLSVMAVHPTFGSEGHWSVFGLPDLVVIGTLEDIEEDVHFFECESGHYENRVERSYWNSGWVLVEKVLEGDSTVKRVPVLWYSRTALYPPVEGVKIRVAGHKEPREGERRIWVFFKPGRFAEPLSHHREFQDLPVESIDEVESELEKLRQKETEKPLVPERHEVK